MVPRMSRHWSWLVLLMAVVGCKCKDPGVDAVNQCSGVQGAEATRKEACSSDDQCSDHHLCLEMRDQPGVKCCVLADRVCATSADCCPGQRCIDNRKRCFNQWEECEKTEDCSTKPGRVCEPYQEASGEMVTVCRYPSCGANGECAAGLECFQGECIQGLPCGGSCPAGQGCVPSAKQDSHCQEYANPTRQMGACPMTCNAGFIATFKDNRNSFDACRLPEVQCLCAENPTLRSDDLGRFSAIAAEAGQGVVVSQYDGRYGDLVVSRYGLDGRRNRFEYVDGVPQGRATYGPSGPRGGVEAPGPDVGRYTDVALGQGGLVYVSYYDVTNGDLKVAMRGTDGRWQTLKVDGSTGDVGQYTSIALDGDGHPVVSYFQRSGEAGFMASECPAPVPTVAVKYITALKLARASKALPTQAADWSVKTVACVGRPPPPCDGCMGTCADVGDGPTCFAAMGTCAAACDPNTEVCVESAGSGKCGRKYNPSQLLDVPLGVGVFSSLAIRGNDTLIAYQRRELKPATLTADGGAGRLVPDGDLYVVRVSSTNVVSTPVLVDGSGDTGYFPDLKVNPSNQQLAVSYHDATSKSLKFVTAGQLTANLTAEVVDKGIDAATPGTQSIVGTDSAVVFAPSGGQVWLVYQDATKGDLKVARRTNTWQVQPPVSTDGAVGFFADAVFTDGKVYASHARLKAKSVAGMTGVDNTLMVEQFPGN